MTLKGINYFLTISIISLELTYSQTKMWCSIGPEGVPYDSEIYVNPESSEIAYFIGNKKLYKTITSGDNWYEITPNIPDIPDVYSKMKLFINNNNPDEIFFIYKYVYRSSDGGENWQLLYSDDTRIVMNMDSRNPNFMICKEGEKLSKTTDGGKNWIDIVSDLDMEKGEILYWFNFYNPQIIIANQLITFGGDVIHDMKTYITVNAGITWDSTEFDQVVCNVAFDPGDSNNIYIKSLDEGWIKSSNHGEDWFEIGADISEEKYNLVVHPEHSDTLYFLVEKEFSIQGIYISTDGGNNWTLTHTIPQSRDLASFAVSPQNDETIYISSFPLDILYTNNNGLEWHKKTSGLFLCSVDYLRTGLDNSLYAGINNQGIYRSKDYGQTWENIHCNFSSSPLNIVLSKTNPALMFRMLNGLSYSEDYGNSWVTKTNNSINFWNFDVGGDNQTVYVSIYTSQNGNVLAGIAKSQDLGTNWETFELNITEDNCYINEIEKIQVDSYDPQTAYAVAWIRGESNKNVLVRTINGGHDWEIISDYPKYYLNRYRYPINTIYVWNNEEFYKSDDKGNTWELISELPDSTVWVYDFEIDPYNLSTFYVSTYNNGVLWSIDEGKAWSVLVEKNYYLTINDIAVSRYDSSHSILYGATENAGVQYLIIENPITSVSNSKDTFINNYFLLNNYPNPFNNTTNIVYTLLKNSDVILSIYDITGRLLETIVNQHQNAGTFSICWNASRYSSGVYLYKIKADEFQQVKKMLLIK